MADIRLIDNDGKLYFGPDNIVLCIHPEGDCDSIPWPMKSEFNTPEEIRRHLACALFDARETGEIPADTRHVILPDNTTFEIDQ